MENKLPVFLVLLLLLVLLVALPIDMRQTCRQRKRIDWEAYAQRLVDEGQFHKCYKMSFSSFMALAAMLEPYLPVDVKQSPAGPTTMYVKSAV
ncbi:hypothetical protein PF002_g32737 [Phytophthora fragariae]|uniref:Uncharacterized protein n=1 Tax=Phytophthora fragariae TaxID=53985 RepID=A0A6A3GKE4_9STRA|nr:hypothetical protein PF011_g31329 [Phytophthora fragariae]KAE9159979.1 hypothetical protein PF002_g32737 [Phytophthora fragariae]